MTNQWVGARRGAGALAALGLGITLALAGVPGASAAGSSISFTVTGGWPTPTQQGIGLKLTLEAHVLDNGQPVATSVGFQVVSGPNEGTRWAVTSNASGVATSTYTSLLLGTDMVDAVFVDSGDNLVESANVAVSWVDQSRLFLCLGTTSCPNNGSLSGGLPLLLRATDVKDTDGRFVLGVTVVFVVLSGPDTSIHPVATTDSGGKAQVFFRNLLPGTDTVVATFKNVVGRTVTSPPVTITWTGSSQTITFPQPPDGQVGGAPVALAASATSGLPVTFTSGSPSVCSISGATAIPLSSGICVVTASQPGGPAFYPAQSVTQAFTVAASPVPVGPAVSPPALRLAAPGPVSATSVPVRISWHGTTAGSPLVAYELQCRNGGGAWLDTPLPTPLATSVTRGLTIGASRQCRARAADAAGHTGDWATSVAATLKVYQESSSAITYGGRWSTRTSPDAWGGKTKSASSVGASATFRFTGLAVALVAPRRPGLGMLRVYLDGRLVKTISLSASSSKARQVVFTTGWSSVASHTLKVSVAGPSGRVDLDGFAVLH